jgi:voltage-gated potassium channel
MKKYFDSMGEVVFYYFLFLFSVAIAFSLAESVSLADSFYWAFVSATSTGYGDVLPKTVIGKVITFVTIHAGVFFFAPLVVIRLLDKLIEDKNQFTHEEQLHIMQKIEEISNKLDKKGL